MIVLWSILRRTTTAIVIIRIRMRIIASVRKEMGLGRTTRLWSRFRLKLGMGMSWERMMSILSLLIWLLLILAWEL